MLVNSAVLAAISAKRSKISEILWLSVDSILLTSYLPDISECYIESGLCNSFKYQNAYNLSGLLLAYIMAEALAVWSDIDTLIVCILNY